MSQVLFVHPTYNRRTLAVMICLFSAVDIGPAGAGSETVPVMIGGNVRYDACMSQGEIVGLDSAGDGFLSVRSGPGGRAYVETDRLYNRDKVWICGYGHMPWYPVVYSRSGRSDCLAHINNALQTVYRGPCRAGWIHSRYVSVIAG